MTPWNVASNAHIEVWSTETSDMAALLRDLADTLATTPGMVLLTLVNGPGEPYHPAAFSVQATLSIDEAATA